MSTQLWSIDPTHSSISFTVRHMMFAKVHGRFTQFSVQLALDESNLPASSVSASIEASSVDTGVADRDVHLRSADFFDADQHPALRFKSTTVEATPAGLLIHGTLEIRGVQQPVRLEATHEGTGVDPWGNRRAAFTARTTISRKAFGLTWNQALEAGGVLVGDDIAIALDIQAIAPAG